MLHTSDIHSRFLPYDLAPLKTDADLGLAPEAPPYGGAARLAALIRREKARADRSLLVDSGDYWQGGPIFNASDGEPEMKWMSLMNYDAVVMGNHEFDKGVMNFSDKYTRFGHYPLLAANYWWENRNQPNSTNFDKMSAPYTLTNVRGLRVAMLGMASIGSMYGLVDGGNSTQATPIEQNECARAYVEMLKPITDMVVVVSHLGLTEDQDLVTGYDAYYPLDSARPFLERKDTDLTRWQQIEPSLSQCEAEGTPREKCTFLDGTVRVFIPGVSGIDIIEGGHLHIVLNPPQVLRDPTGRPVILSHSGAFAKYLGRLERDADAAGRARRRPQQRRVQGLAGAQGRGRRGDRARLPRVPGRCDLVRRRGPVVALLRAVRAVQVAHHHPPARQPRQRRHALLPRPLLGRDDDRGRQARRVRHGLHQQVRPRLPHLRVRPLPAHRLPGPVRALLAAGGPADDGAALAVRHRARLHLRAHPHLRLRPPRESPGATPPAAATAPWAT
ncbi:MAG: metallophosphatase [Myxococcales bacterium]